jgi:hypothetical protein
LNDKLWVIEYSFFHDAFGVLQMDEHLAKVQRNFAKQHLHPYVILDIYPTHEQASAECATLQKRRETHFVSLETRRRAFQACAEELRAMVEKEAR